MTEPGEPLEVGLQHFPAPDGPVGSVTSAVQHHRQNRSLQIVFSHYRRRMGVMMLNLVEGEIEIPGIMGTEIVGMQVAGGGNRFYLIKPFEIVDRFGVKAERGGVEQIANMLAWIDRRVARQAESRFQSAPTADELR